MKSLLTAAQMKELDRRAIEEEGIPSLTLMENAAQAVADEAWQMAEKRDAGFQGVIMGRFDVGEPLEERAETAEVERICASKAGKRFTVYCGVGNNGGDGLAAARILLKRGAEVRAFLVGDRARMTPDALEMERRLLACGGTVEPFCTEDGRQYAWGATSDIIIDAIFGIGLKREAGGDFLAAIRHINSLHAGVLSVDIPSGVETDTGNILGEAVRAKRTVTFSSWKPGLLLGAGGPCAGEIREAQIGIPQSCNPKEITFLARRGGDIRLPVRRRDAHKGDFGKIYIVAGSVGFTGAPVLAAGGALRSGAGLVTLGVPQSAWPIVAAKCLEVMPEPLPEEPGGTLSAGGIPQLLERIKGRSAILVGPGLGRTPGVEAVVGAILDHADCPVVVDADGLNALSAHIDRLDGRHALTVLTPHAGEYERLGGGDPASFARRHNCVLVLKGHRTITAFPTGEVIVNTTGNPGMAKGGSGDVLAGIITSLLGQGMGLFEAVPDAVFLHGRAGDLCAEEKGEYGMTPGDLIEMLPRAFREH